MHSTIETGQIEHSVLLFTNPSFGTVRTAGTAINPKFCLADLCKILDLSVKGVNQRLDKEVISNYPLQTAGGIQQMKFVNEDGLYDVILDSRKPEAKAFRKWITSEVLPAIRRTGGYIQQDEGDSEADIMAKALMIAQRTINDKAQRIQMLEGENKHLQVENSVLAPKAQYTDEVLQSTNTLTFTEVAKELNFRSANALLHRLLADKVIYRQSGRYLPTARYSGLGLFTSRTHRFYHADGRPDTSVMTVVTEKGRMFFHKYFRVEPAPIDANDVMQEVVL